MSRGASETASNRITTAAIKKGGGSRRERKRDEEKKRQKGILGCNENRVVPAGLTAKPTNRTPNRYGTADVPDTQENRSKSVGLYIIIFFKFHP
ncbi:hypothetical protein Lal_00018746 [Lupinus albus]|nr:hypothetical protein Lal_00018746 [Lupinus albus]